MAGQFQVAAVDLAWDDALAGQVAAADPDPAGMSVLALCF